VLVAHDAELDAFHQLAAIDAARPGGRSRAERAGLCPGWWCKRPRVKPLA
jgi:hypothetical protein